jgi:hypothetical protein
MLQCGRIWFAGGKFGVTWKPYQMIVKPKHQMLPGVCHISVNEAEAKVTPKEKEQSEFVDSDEDPEREYMPAPPALERSMTETLRVLSDALESTEAEAAEVTETGDVPEVPVKGRKKVTKT